MGQAYTVAVRKRQETDADWNVEYVVSVRVRVERIGHDPVGHNDTYRAPTG